MECSSDGSDFRDLRYDKWLSYSGGYSVVETAGGL